MKQAMPWSVKGVEATARDAAKDAARRAGMTLGEWLNTVIAETAAEQDGTERGRPGETSLEERLGRLGRGATETSGAGARSTNDLASVLERAIEQSRLQANQIEGRTAGALDALVRWVERTDRQRRDDMGSIAHAQERTSVALREALALVTTRLNAMEQSIDSGRERDLAPMRKAIQRLEGRIDDLGHREQQGPVPARIAVSLKQLEDLLLDIAGRLEKRSENRAEAVAPERIARIESTLGSLVELLRRQPGEAADDQDDHLLAEGDADGLDAALHEIRARQRSLDQAAGPALDGSALRHLEALREDMAGLTRRLDDLARQPTAELHPLARDLAALSAAVQDLSPRKDIEALERALRDLGREVQAGRQGIPAEAGAGASVDGLAGDLARLAADLAPLKALGQLRDDVETLGQRLDRLPDDVSRSAALETMASEIAQLKALVAGTAGAAEAAPSVEKAIAGLTERLDLDLAVGGSVDPAALSGLQKSIDDMRWSLGALTETLGRPEAMLGRIEERIEAVAARVDSLAPTGPDPLVADLSARMAKLQDSIEARLAAEPDRGGLEALIRSLQERLEAPAAPAVQPSSFDALEQHLAAMSGALERSDDNVAALRAMESAIGELFSRIDEAKHSTIEAAERAAMRAASAQARPAPDTPAPAPDERTTQALEAVQDTMERIVERLAMLESDMTSDRVRLMELAERATAVPRQESMPAAAPAPQNAAEKIAAAAAAAQAARNLELASAPRAPRKEKSSGLRSDVRSEPAPLPPAPTLPLADVKALAAAARASMVPGPLPPLPVMEPAADAVTEPRTEARSEPEATLHSAAFEDEMLLEPGTGRPGDLAEPEADAVAGEPAAADHPMASFIASARMAAQNAGGAPAGAGRGKPPRDGERELAQAAAAAVAARSRGTTDSRRRPILLGLAALVVALGTVQVVRLVMSDGPGMGPGQSPKAPVSAPADPGQVTTPAPAQPAPAPDQKSEVPAPDKSAASLLAPKAEAPGTFASQPPAIASSQSFAPRAPEPDTVGAIGQGQTMGATGLTGDQGKGMQLPMGDIPPGALPAALARAAGSGSPAALYEVASRYFDGRGLQRDPRAAAKWFEKAASQGFAPAQYRLGSMYEKGIGVPADPVQARNWYRQAADRGNAKAMHNLGVIIAEGSGGKPDYEQAAIWFRRAAELGVRDSQYNLAILTARGLGVPQNLAQSYTWFALAAAQGDEDAARKRDEVGAKLDPGTLASARAAADTFKPARLDEIANDTGAPAGGWDAEASAVPGKGKSKN